MNRQIYSYAVDYWYSASIATAIRFSIVVILAAIVVVRFADSSYYDVFVVILFVGFSTTYIATEIVINRYARQLIFELADSDWDPFSQTSQVNLSESKLEQRKRDDTLSVAYIDISEFADWELKKKNPTNPKEKQKQ